LLTAQHAWPFFARRAQADCGTRALAGCPRLTGGWRAGCPRLRGAWRGRLPTAEACLAGPAADISGVPG
jgi:hypothetical protein